MIADADLLRFRAIDLEDERDEIAPDAYAELEAIRKDWRARGDEMRILLWQDGVSGLLRHPQHGDPPTLETLRQCRTRAQQLDILINEPAQGHA